MLGIIKTLILNQITDTFKIRRKPRVIQLPVTSRCNSRCVTCNVWKNHEKTDIDPKELRRVFADKFFSKVQSVGVNGGEITLVPNIDEIVDAVLTLPALKTVYFISNGLLPDRLLPMLERFKQRANARGVKVSLQLSVDGVDNVHETTRGIPGCFPRTLRILQTMADEPGRYCDLFSMGCTISRSNVAYLRQVVALAEKFGHECYFHLAVPNKRIHTFDDSGYSVLNDERSRLLAMEFFMERMSRESLRRNPFKRFNYFAAFHYLDNRGHGRLSHCSYRHRDITIDENLNAYLCATASDSLGNFKGAEAPQLLKGKKFRQVRKNVENCCDTCIHYAAEPTISGLWKFIVHTIRHRRSVSKFK